MLLIRKCCTPVKAALVSEDWGRRLLGCLSICERERKKWYRHIGPRAKILSHSVCMTHVLKLFKHAHTRKQLFMPPLFTLPWPKCPYNISIIIFCLNPNKKIDNMPYDIITFYLLQYASNKSTQQARILVHYHNKMYIFVHGKWLKWWILSTE